MTLLQTVCVIMAVALIPEADDNWFLGFLGFVGIFVALDATEFMAVMRAGGDNTDLLYRKHRH
jgi:hypothetical protein